MIQMTRKLILMRICFFCSGLMLLCALNCSNNADTSNNNSLKTQRIISLAPSITETLCALDLYDNIVGVTNFCDYPPSVKTIEKVGTYTEPNGEKIFSLRPDLVILVQEHEKIKQFLLHHNIPFLEIQNNTLESICNSFITIGRRCGRQKEADSLVKTFEPYLDPAPPGGHCQPSLLICIGRDAPGSGTITRIYAAGKHTFYTELLEAAGASNCYSDTTLRYPQLSREGIIALRPDIIIDIAPSMRSISDKALVRDWQHLSMVPAVHNNMVFCIDQDFATIPGPRLLLLGLEIHSIITQYMKERAQKVSD